MIRWEMMKAVFSEFIEKMLYIAGDMQGDDPSSKSLESLQPLGIRSRPMDPDVDPKGERGEGPSVFTIWDGNEGYAMPLGDPRALERIPEGQKGSFCAHSTGTRPSYILIEGDGSHQYLAQYPDGSKSHVIVMEVHESGKENVQIRHADGHAIALLPGKVVISGPGKPYIEINANEIVLNGNIKLNGGILAGDVTSGQPVTIKPDVDALLAAINNALTTVGLTVAGAVAKLGAPLVVPMPGSSKAKASP